VSFAGGALGSRSACASFRRCRACLLPGASPAPDAAVVVRGRSIACAGDVLKVRPPDTHSSVQSQTV
jgi:hypothetical protein